MTFYPIRIYSSLGEQRQTEVSNKGDRRQAASRPPADRGGDGDTLVSRTLRFYFIDSCGFYSPDDILCNRK